MSVPKTLAPYRDLGVDVSNHTKNGENVVCDCPFCGKEQHFNISVETGQFRCVRCETVGNAASFIQQLHEASCNYTDSLTAGEDEDDSRVWGYDVALIADRGLSPESLRACGVCVSIIDGRWLLPIYNADGKIANLGIWNEVEEGTRVVYYVSEMKQHLYGLDQLPFFQEKPPKEIWILEGPWDRIAAYDMLSHLRSKGTKLVETENPDVSIAREILLLAKPSAGAFSVEWSQLLKEKFPGEKTIVRVVSHNDHPKINERSGKVTHPGWDGALRTCDLLRSVGYRNVYITHWGADAHPSHSLELKDGYDVRDLHKEADSPLFAFYSLRDKFQQFTPASNAAHQTKTRKKTEKQRVEQTNEAAIHCDCFEELLDGFKKFLYVPEDLEDTILMMIAATISTNAPEDPLWLRVIGPPGCGKTTVAESFSAAQPFVIPLSKLTGLHSGYVENFDTETDNSLMPLIEGKAVMVKDADTVMSSNSRDTILSEFRDIFDGDSRSQYRNKSGRKYESFKTTFILCGTDSLRGMSKTFLGERFLDLEVVAAGADYTPYVKASMSKTRNSLLSYMRSKNAPKDAPVEAPNPTALAYLRPRMYGFLNHLTRDGAPSPDLDDKRMLELEGMAKAVAVMRAQIDPHLKDMGVETRAEYPTRVSSQLIRGALYSAVALQRPAVDDRVMRACRKLVFNTCIGHRFKITRLLYDALETDRVTKATIAAKLDVPMTTLDRTLRAMQELRMIVMGKQKNGMSSGRDSSTVRLHQKLRTAFKEAGVPRTR